MIEGSKVGDASAQTPYLLSLGSTITAIPRGLITSQLGQLMPLILQGLSLHDADLQHNMLHVLISILETESDSETNELLQSKARELVDVLLCIAVDSSNASRSAAVSHSAKDNVVRSND